MNVIKFFKIDFIRSKSQSKLFPFFAILTTLMALKFDSPIWSIFYLCFFAIILSTTPFSMQTISNSGFLNMLPASSYSRVAGRYLFAVFMSIIAIIFGGISIAVSYFVNHNLPNNLASLSVLSLAVSIIANSVQYVIFFSIGNIKSKQLMAIIQLIPAFAVFYGVSYLSDYIKAHSDAGLQWINWSLNHLNFIALVTFILSILTLFISLGISNLIVCKKDYMNA
ncbi:MAG: family transporter protein [Anaerocolumna sp.]|nr:family transporter protein [Anaerocolumna sp.]